MEYTGKTIQIGPKNWKEATTIIEVALVNGTDKGKELGRAQLINMANAADLAGELLEVLNLIAPGAELTEYERDKVNTVLAKVKK